MGKVSGTKRESTMLVSLLKKGLAFVQRSHSYKPVSYQRVYWIPQEDALEMRPTLFHSLLMEHDFHILTSKVTPLVLPSLLQCLCQVHFLTLTVEMPLTGVWPAPSPASGFLELWFCGLPFCYFPVQPPTHPFSFTSRVVLQLIPTWGFISCIWKTTLLGATNSVWYGLIPWPSLGPLWLGILWV